jgi:cation-transporting ATPase 13A3/4/5
MGAVSIFGFLISLNYMIREGMSLLRIINVGLDLLTLTIHPALPICLGIGISFAIRRLKKYGISCINRKRINLAGQVNLVCFDKTGTLTEDHLDIYGFRPINYNNGNFVFDSFKSDCSKLVEDCYRFQKANKKDILSASSGKDINFSNISREEKIKLLTVFYVECLATCHSIFRANGRLMGDPLDIEMFKSTGWVFIESFEEKDNYDPLVLSNVRHPLEKDTKELLEKLDAFNSENYDIEENILKSQYELSIIRRFEFNSNLQRMTVIVKDVNEQNFKIYCKGSPEKILELCREDTLPHNFSQILANYTEKGFRVIALCCKLIKMDYFQSQKIGRDIAENNMIFLGFIVVQNKLKENTTTTIEKLHEAGLKLIMATGDNMLTAVSVSKECKMIPSLSNVFQCEIIPFNNNEYYLNCKNLFKENSNAGNEDMSERDSKNHGISSNNNSLNNNDDQIEFNRDSKLTNNLNVNSIDQFIVDEYDSEDYDDEYNITRKKKKKIEV